MKKGMASVSAGIVLLLLNGLSGCTGKPDKSDTAATAVTPHDIPFKPTATLQELMASVIDPSADGVWNAVGSETRNKELVDIQPHTADEWKTVRNHAITLLEASNLLLIEGRQIAKPGTKSLTSDELEPEAIQKLIDANRPAFIAHAHALHDVTSQALAAIDAKDPKALVTVGGNIDAVCEACHMQFWYPGQKIPTHPGLKTNHSKS